MRIRSLLMASLSFVPVSAAQAAVLIPIVPVSGSSVTTAFAINDKDIIAGSYIGSSDGIEHCFFGTLAGSYTTFDVGTGGSEANGIDNRGTIVGFSNSQSGVTSSEVPFERSPSGTVQNVTMNGQPLYGRAQNIASKGGKFAGTRWDFTSFEAVAYVGRNSKWTGDVTIPAEHQASGAGGINRAGAVVGFYFQPPDHGYIVQGSNLTKVDYPSNQSQGTTLEAINDKGEAVGQWVDMKGHTHSFEYDSSTATFTDIVVNGAKNVEAWSINAKGVVALGSSKGSYIWCARKKSCPSGGTEVAAETYAGRYLSAPVTR